MSKIKITDSDGNVYTGRLPGSWADVPITQYATLAAATDWPARCRALAAICGLPEQPLLDDSSLCLPILHGAPFLLNGPLPAPLLAAPETFTHQGITYVPAPANLEKINGGQLEALAGFLREHEGNALACAPALLAILYKPEGPKALSGKTKEVALTAEVVEASTRAFDTLPMSVAWPLLQAFLSRSVAFALPIQRYTATARPVEQLLNALETALTSSAPSGSSWNMRRWLTRIWIRRARKMLATPSRPFAFTAPLPSNSRTLTASTNG